MSELDFASRFGHEPEAAATAHGRVNLIGEHTDYCGGFVMPTLISQQIIVQISQRDDDIIHGYSTEFGEESAAIDLIGGDSWLLFVKGALALMTEKGAKLSGLNVMTSSAIPAGAGVSSSAAFEIALLRALCDLTSLAIPAEEMALMGQRIEHDFIGTKCGIMDQMAVARAEIGQALLLDCETLENDVITLPEDICVAVIHSGSSRKLSASLYNERLAETSEAARQMGYNSLRNAKEEDLTKLSDPVLIARSRHVISENARVHTAKAALKIADMGALGLAMTESHISLREDYEVSSDALDHLVSTIISQGAYGARLTGAGFGGCIVALLDEMTADDIIEATLADCEGAWLVDCL
ncbi:MAG: galactokinase [Candidatus Puniceispirillaceae bacterium]